MEGPFVSIVAQGAAAVLAALLSLVFGYLVAYLRTKVKFVSETFLQEVARSGIALAEEQAAAYFRKFGRKMASDGKLERAIEFLLQKVPGVTHEEARAIIQAELPKVSLGAAGFLQAVVAASRTTQPAGSSPPSA